jgi:predicted AAA+ superfamily ATPase
MNFLLRNILISHIKEAISKYPVTAILGPRQCGKTTISKLISKNQPIKIFDLEDPADLVSLTASPKITLESLKGLIIIDEIQRMPELFPILRVLADRQVKGVRYLILGSASPALIKGASESLAGRISFIDMSGFNLEEVGIKNWQQLWFRGGFPRSYLAKNDIESMKWRNNFIRTFLERDIPQFGINIPAITLRRFWTMVAHYHGQLWSSAEFARSIGSSEPTAKKYLDILTDAYVIRQLQPWFANISKRQVKSPRIFIRDSGIFHALLSLKNNQILSHPKLGASWEGFIVEQIISLLDSRDYYFWATHSGAEIDLLVFLEDKAYGFEIKYTDAPSLTKSMKIAFEDLNLSKLFIIYPGNKSYSLNKNTIAIPISELTRISEKL